ncbi:Cytochrome c [Paramuricea clavata]|nr:Cytochrome c [Paramuricea clavata]
MYTPGASGSNVVEDVVKKVEATLGGTNELLKRTAFVESKYGKDTNTYRNGYHGGIWQMDKIGFDDTQNVKSHPKLRKQYAKIREDFGIDWPTVKYQDLRMPLYSGLAARLKYLNVKAPIPSSRQLGSQADYWKRKYNSKKGKGTPMKFISDVLSYDKSPNIEYGNCGKGRKTFIQRGGQCHSCTHGGKHKTGPNLFGICGRSAGSSPGYPYTQAMKDSDITWSEATLDEFLQNPKKMVPGIKMVFAGMKKARERRDLVYYLCKCL